MTRIPRRAVLTGTAATLALAACVNGIGSEGPAQLDARVDATLNFLDSQYPGTHDSRYKSAGMLIIPFLTESSFGF